MRIYASTLKTARTKQNNMATKYYRRETQPDHAPSNPSKIEELLQLAYNIRVGGEFASNHEFYVFEESRTALHCRSFYDLM
jgi:hypothetical protein